MTVLIEAVGLQKQFGDIKAVGGISMRVTKGEVLGFLGPNGAGKSTTMKMITGFLEPDSARPRSAASTFSRRRKKQNQCSAICLRARPPMAR